MLELFASQADDKLYVEDVFSTALYTGNGGSQTITTGIDLSSAGSGPLMQGGLLWIKNRNSTFDHRLFDTVRNLSGLSSNSTAAAPVSTAISSVTTSGFQTASGDSYVAGTGSTYAAWTFRRAKNFFDVVTYTGNSSGQTLNHSLGAVPGMIIVKCTSSVDGWYVWHRGFSVNNNLMLNNTNAIDTAGFQGGVAATSTTFRIGSLSNVNTSGQSYVAYIFGHDASTDGIIQCGSYTGNGSTTGPEINLGWEPQYLLVKNATSSDGWHVIDTARMFNSDSIGRVAYLFTNATNAEATNGIVKPTATGFQLLNGGGVLNTSSNTYIYVAIRRGPMRVPTDATKVFTLAAGTSASRQFPLSGPADMFLARFDRTTTANTWVADRLRGYATAGSPLLKTNLTDAEATPTTAPAVFRNDAASPEPNISLALSATSAANVSYGFKRAPGFFDQVCYTGNNTTLTVPHNLGQVPTMMWVKSRSGTFGWSIYHAALGNTKGLFFDTPAAATNTYWNNTTPTASSFTVGGLAPVNNAGPMVAYLFGDVPGVSKAGTYSGSGSDVTINCGFAPRFVLVKRTDTAGEWLMFDTARGIVAAADPYLFLSSSSAEGTTLDVIDPIAGGFTLVGSIAATNFAGGTYIYYAIA
jgi:hypothetical protein